MLHITDAAEGGFNKILVRTVDTDVVVLAVATVQELGMIEIWVAFGTGKDMRYVPACRMARYYELNTPIELSNSLYSTCHI